jgi:hypothetical protein
MYSEKMDEYHKSRQNKSNLDFIFKHMQVPENKYKKISSKSRVAPQKIAVGIGQLVRVPLDRQTSLNDIEAFEEALGVRVMVVSAKLGNKFISSPRKTIDHVYTYITSTLTIFTQSQTSRDSSAQDTFAIIALYISTTGRHTCVKGHALFAKRTIV